MDIKFKKKYAFISYSHKDEKMAKWLQRKLESYKLPTNIHNEYENSRYLRPIFRDQTDLSVGVLTDELKNNLFNSKYLIVVCSPNSAQSQWVNEEVRTFIEWGRIGNIILFVIDGELNRYSDYLPFVLREYVKKHPECELLASDIRVSGKEHAYIRIVSGMLQVDFDVLWQRHIREKRRRLFIWSVVSLLACFFFYCFAIPIKIQITLMDAKHILPQKGKGVLYINDKAYLLTNYDTIVSDVLPGYFRFNSIPISFDATFYNTLDSQIKCNFFSVISEHYLLLERDNTFSYYAGIVLDSDEQPLSNVEVSVDSYFCLTDEYGKFFIVLPLDKQDITKTIVLKKNGEVLYQRKDESPSMKLLYIVNNQK